MKRKILAAALAFLMLCGCAGKNVADPNTDKNDKVEKAPYTLAVADELLNSGAFEGSEMQPVPMQVASVLYGIEAEDIVECVIYIAANTSASADELAVFVMSDEQAAIDAEAVFHTRVESQLKVVGQYAPNAVPRLEGAFISRRENTVVFAIGDPDVIASIKSIH
jgi:hypothetical protein